MLDEIVGSRKTELAGVRRLLNKRGVLKVVLYEDSKDYNYRTRQTDA